MNKRYLPIIVDETGKTYENIHYTTLAEAMEALEEFIQIFSKARDNHIVETYVLNVHTGKHIIP